MSSANSAIKTHYGYAGSEDRSQAERQAAAHRIVAKADPEIEEQARAIWANAAASGLYDARSKQPNPR